MERASHIEIQHFLRSFTRPAGTPALDSNRHWLYKALMKIVGKVACVFLLACVPLALLVKSYSAENGFLSLILFGQEFESTRLEEVNRIAPPVESPRGYDGQFYAQAALYPALDHPGLGRALDSPAYRAKRIGLPFLAFCLGAGNPHAILQVYALLNVAFWVLLLVALCRRTGLRSGQDFWMTLALLCSTGALVSVARALTDFPAAVLCVLATLIRPDRFGSVALLGAAALFRETSILSWPAMPWPRQSATRRVVSFLLLALPIAVWSVYVRVRLGANLPTGSGIFAPPFVGIFAKFRDSVPALVTLFSDASPALRLQRLFEVLSPLSLCAQFVYLIVRPRRDATSWRMGIGFAALFCVLGSDIWIEQVGYCRALLPLTLSFNLLIHQYEKGRKFALWYGLGNIGMAWMALTIVG